ncbi:31292_t:CDS:2, partial [Gigaspora margarita]
MYKLDKDDLGLLQDLTEIELLLKTLCNDESIVRNIVLQNVYNDEQDQDSAFIQAIFWAYRDSIAKFLVEKAVLIIDATYKMNRFSMPLVAIWDAQVKSIITDRELALIKAISNIFSSTKHQLCTWHIFKTIKNKLRKNVDIGEFVKAVQKLTYRDFLESQIEQEIDMFNINLDIKSSQYIESLHSKLKGVKNQVVLVDRMFTILWKQMKEHLQKLAYEIFIHQNRHSHDKSDTGLEQLKLQKDLVKSGDYEVFETDNCVYNIMRIDDTSQIHIVHFGAPTWKNTRTATNADKNKKYNLSLKKTHIGQKSKISINNAENCNNDNIEVPKIKRACDGYCEFQSLAIAIFKEEKKWQDIKIAMKKYLNKQEEIYDNILGYDIKRLIAILLYLEPKYPYDYWFYTPEYAQLASNIFNMPVVAFGTDPTSSILFLPFDQKPGC